MNQFPLIQGYSPEAIAENIKRLEAEGYPHDQAVAIAMETARKAREKAGK